MNIINKNILKAINKQFQMKKEKNNFIILMIKMNNKFLKHNKMKKNNKFYLKK